MLFTAEKTTTETLTYAVDFPIYVKHVNHDWFLLITETAAVQLLPWAVKVERRNEFPSFYRNKTLDALSSEYTPCTKELFEENLNAVIDNLQNLLK